MKITYDLEILPERRGNGGTKNEETLALIAFLASTKKNMCITYDDEKVCTNKYKSIRAYRSQKKLKEVFDLYRVGKSIYIIRTKKTGGARKKEEAGKVAQ